MRLRSGGAAHKGYLEMYRSDRWGLVCDDEWTLAEAEVVCRQLGFSRGVRRTTQARFILGVDRPNGMNPGLPYYGTSDS